MDETLKYAVEIDDQTAAAIQRINQRLSDVQARANASNASVIAAAQRAMAAATGTSAGASGVGGDDFLRRPINPLPPGFGDKMASEVEGGLKRIDRGLFKTFGGIGQIMSGSFRAGMMQISQGLNEITGKSTAALGQMAMKAGAVGAAFGAGWKLGKLLDEALGISDRIARSFDMGDPLKELDKYRDGLRQIRETKLDALKKEFDDLAEAAQRADEKARLLTERRLIQAERGGQAGAEYGIEMEGVQTREKVAQDQITAAETRKAALDKQVQDAERYAREVMANGSGIGVVRQARQGVLSARTEREQQAPVLQATIEREKMTLEKLAVERERIELKTDKTIESNKQDAQKAEKKAFDDEFQARLDAADAEERRGNQVLRRHEEQQQEVKQAEFKRMDEADAKDRRIIEQSNDRQEKLAEIVEDRKDKVQMTAHERRESRKTDRDKARDEKSAARRQELLEKSALRAQKRIENAERGLGLGGRLSRRQQEALEGIKAREALDREKGIANKAKADIEAREKRRLEVEEGVELNTKMMVGALWRIEDNLTLP